MGTPVSRWTIGLGLVALGFVAAVAFMVAEGRPTVSDVELGIVRGLMLVGYCVCAIDVCCAAFDDTRRWGAVMSRLIILGVAIACHGSVAVAVVEAIVA